MNAMIDSKGCLWVKREERKWKRQYCPVSNRGGWCGDDCPLFYEHEGVTSVPGRIHLVSLKCGDNVEYKITEDERQ